jgi:predicted transcriptional regulator
MQEPLYDNEKLKQDKEYVLRKLGVSEKEFEEIMNLPAKSHYDYKSNEKLLKMLRKIYTKFAGH